MSYGRHLLIPTSRRYLVQMVDSPFQTLQGESSASLPLKSPTSPKQRYQSKARNPISAQGSKDFEGKQNSSQGSNEKGQGSSRQPTAGHPRSHNQRYDAPNRSNDRPVIAESTRWPKFDRRSPSQPESSRTPRESRQARPVMHFNDSWRSNGSPNPANREPSFQHDRPRSHNAFSQGGSRFRANGPQLPPPPRKKDIEDGVSSDDQMSLLEKLPSDGASLQTQLEVLSAVCIFYLDYCARLTVWVANESFCCCNKDPAGSSMAITEGFGLGCSAKIF